MARDDDVLAFLAAMPPAKRQPNLLLGAVRYLYRHAVDGAREFLELIHAHRGRDRAR